MENHGILNVSGVFIVRWIWIKNDGPERGLPKMIRVDNGSEMTALLFTPWCAENGVTIRYIEPGKPNQNAYIERFSYRNEVLAPICSLA